MQREREEMSKQLQINHKSSQLSHEQNLATLRDELSNLQQKHEEANKHMEVW